MGKDGLKFRLTEARTCPTCEATFDAASGRTHCPEDATLGPRSLEYLDKFIASIQRLDLSPLVCFPSKDVAMISFDVFIEWDGTLKLMAHHILR